MPQEPLIATLDVGTSSVRSLLFAADGREIDGFGSQITYHVRTTADGGFEMDADPLVEIAGRALDALCGQLRQAKLKPAAVAIDTFWHSVTAISSDNRPLTPILHLFDTRSAKQADELKTRVDADAVHARTGALLHPSYYPAKLLWLRETRPEVFRGVKLWASFGEYLFLKLFGKPVTSTSMVSGTGIWDQNRNDYDAELMQVIGVAPGQFAPKTEMDQPCSNLTGDFAQRWPELDAIPWFPALGDGACNNVGSGCVSKDRFALMVGTSGAMRAVVEESSVEIPKGLWCYRVDPHRFVLGGALSDGGSVYAWLRSTLTLPDPQELEKQMAAIQPGAHGLTSLPLFAGERSPGWNPSARAAFTGLSIHTSAVEIARSALEGVALRFRAVYDLMTQSLGVPQTVVASGGALLHSPVWTQMMADALARRVDSCIEKEATSRGAALLALERLGAIRSIADVPARMGASFDTTPEHHDAYDRMLRVQSRLYDKLFKEPW